MAGRRSNTTNWKGSHNIQTSEDGEVPKYCINGTPIDTAETIVIEVSTDYTATPDDDVIIGDGPLTLSLFPVAESVKNLFVKSLLGGGNVTIDPSGSETIEGSATYALTPATSITLSRSAGGWVII